MKKAKFLAIALAVSLGMVMLACSQPMGYVSDNNEAAQTVIALLASPPAVTSVTETTFGTDTTDHYVDMPATVNAGDLLIVLFTNDGSATVTTPDGWSSLASDANGSAVRLSVYYKISAGTEGGTTVDFVTSANEQAAAQVYRITDWNGTTPPEISTAATNTTPTPNPPSLNPAGWDVTDTLWLAVGGQDRGDQSGTTTYPAGYGDGIGTLSSATTDSCRTLSARRVHATASENPGTFTIPVSEEWVAFTIAVRPALRDLTISSTPGGSVTTPSEGVFTYDEGTVVDLVATPVAGYRFVNWTGNVSAVEDVYGAETTITVNGDCAVTANFVALHDLTISIFSTGGGSVTEPGEGVFTYDEGTLVDLVAIPDAGYRFVEWTGDVGTIADVHDASTTITMNGDYAVTANFVAIYDLTVSSTEGGSVTEPGEGVFTYDEGTVVDLVAPPDEGYRFVEWTGDVGTIADVHDATTTITMNGNYAVTANFIKQHDLTTNSTEGGLVIEPGEGVFTYDEGTVVDLVAPPDEGYRFVEWTGGVGTIADAYDASTTITMKGDYAITANFVAIYDLTISSTEGGSVTEPGEGVSTYDEGTVVDVVATPDVGYRFVNWTGDVGTIADVYAASTTIAMNGDYAITANFVAIYDLTISSTEGGSVTEPGEEVFIYDEGTVVDLVATPDAGYRFVEWTGHVGTIANVYDPSTTITMNGDYAITADFVAIYDLTISSTAGGSVAEPGEEVFTYDEGTVVDVVATPDAGYRFVNWTGDVGTVANVTAGTTTIRMNGDYSISANFVRQYTLTVTSTAGGLITAPGEGIFAYDAGTVVNLLATPATGYRFVNWTGDVGAIKNTNAASTTIAMTGNYSITANFEAIAPWVPPAVQYGLIVSLGTGGSAISPGVGIFAYDAGTVVSLVAMPANGYRFVNWTGGVDTVANVYAASTTITMNKDYSIRPNFVAIYNLSIASTKGVSVIEPGEGVFSYDEGTVVDLVAEAEEDYRFVQWTGDVGTIADVYAAETTITINDDYSITANFERIPPSEVYPTVTTRVAADITTNSATLGMSYTVGDFSPVEVRFAYRKSTDSTWSYTVWVSKTAGGTHAEVLTGLDFNTAYDFKSQLKYDGTVVGGTTLQFTTDTPSPSGSGPCFIATAAYGTPTAKQIDLLREFRDVVLLKSTVGSQFVALYYQVSPPIADFVAGNELLRTLVRELLVDPIVWVVQVTGDTRQN
jgi:uncharacterized repeat protein (TIGR02543 family)